MSSTPGTASRSESTALRCAAHPPPAGADPRSPDCRSRPSRGQLRRRDRACLGAGDRGGRAAARPDRRRAGRRSRSSGPPNPDHGDLATNLAMKLARPYRRPPLDIAGRSLAELVREARPIPAATPIGSADVAPPGFLNLRIADRALAGDGRRAILADPPTWGRVAAERAARGQRRVRVGQPDRAAAHRQRPRRVRRRPPVPGPRGRRPTA